MMSELNVFLTDKMQIPPRWRWVARTAHTAFICVVEPFRIGFDTDP